MSDSSVVLNPAQLMGGEIFWRDRYKWLHERGYKLRPRYKPGWKPSWLSDKGKVLKDFRSCEDGRWLPMPYTICDATRISDGAYVTLKSISPSRHPHEIEISNFLSSKDLASDPHNHCVPIYEVLTVPDVEDRAILVMPLLRMCDDTPFQTFGESVDFMRQLIEGLQFMHSHHVAHRDCCSANIMMDGSMFPRSWHPTEELMNRECSGKAKYYTRTQCPPKYYLVNFGISARYHARDLPVRVAPVYGADRTVPEFRHSQHSTARYDPFPADVYYLGNMFRMDFVRAKRGFEFLDPLIAKMVQDDPIKRPKMNEVARNFHEICKGLSKAKLQSRLKSRH